MKQSPLVMVADVVEKEHLMLLAEEELDKKREALRQKMLQLKPLQEEIRELREEIREKMTILRKKIRNLPIN